MSTYVQVVLL